MHPRPPHPAGSFAVASTSEWFARALLAELVALGCEDVHIIDSAIGHHQRPRAVLVGVDGPSSRPLMDQVKAAWPDVPTVAVTLQRDPRPNLREIDTLFDSILRIEQMYLFGHVVELAEAGISAIPREMMTSARLAEGPGSITVVEWDWLDDLRLGMTVMDLAKKSGYSERSMHRRLHELYVRLGVSGRSEALNLRRSE